MAKIKRKVRRATAPPTVVEAAVTSTVEEAATTAESTPAARTHGQFQDPLAVVTPETIPYKFWREWWRARDRGDFAFIYELSAEGSPLREHFGAAAEFPEVCRRKIRPVIGVVPGDLKKIRLHGEREAYFVSAIGLKARERRDYDAERWFLLQTDAGWRVHQIDRITVSKQRDPSTLTLGDFPPVTFPSGVDPANA